MHMQPAHGFPAFGYNCMPGMHMLQQVPHGTMPHMAAYHDASHGAAQRDDLSAQDAAQVLYTIAKAESDANDDDEHGEQLQQHAMCVVSGVPTRGYPMSHPAGIPFVVAGHCSAAPHASGGEPVSADGALRAATPDADGTADGVPVDALGGGAAGVPTMVAWGADGSATGQPLHMAMTPHGVMPVMQGGQQFLMPVQTVVGPDGEHMTVMMQGLPPGAVLAGGTAAGAPLMMNDDGSFTMVEGTQTGASVAGPAAGIKRGSGRCGSCLHLDERFLFLRHHMFWLASCMLDPLAVPTLLSTAVSHRCSALLNNVSQLFSSGSTCAVCLRTCFQWLCAWLRHRK